MLKGPFRWTIGLGCCLALATGGHAASLLSASDFGFSGPLVPLHNPLIEGIHNHENATGIDEITAFGQDRIRVYVAIQPDDPLAPSTGQVSFVIGNSIKVQSSDLFQGFGTTPPLDDNPDFAEGAGDFRIDQIHIFDFGDILTFAGVPTIEYSNPGIDLNVGTGKLPGGNNVKSSTVDHSGLPHGDDHSQDLAGHDLGETAEVILKGNGNDAIDVGEWAILHFDYASAPQDLFDNIDKIFLGFHAGSFSIEAVSCDPQQVNDPCNWQDEDLGSAAFWTTMPLTTEDGGTPVPEPASLALLLTGAAGMALWGRRRR